MHKTDGRTGPALHRTYYVRSARNKATPLFRAVNNPLALTSRTGSERHGGGTIGKSKEETGKPMPHGLWRPGGRGRGKVLGLQLLSLGRLVLTRWQLCFPDGACACAVAYASF